ncbi:MAG: 3-hydroxyacyl-CoA dehydrogenase NAD-binding domain-containing protein [Ghiorsea sp.]
MSDLTMWKLTVDEDKVAWLHFDVPESSVNTLSQLAVKELSAALDEVEKKDVKGLVILSDKPSGFIFGADVAEFTKIKTAVEAQKVMGKAHAVFNQLENLNIPTVALIHGQCLGGGLELALACDYRVVEDNAQLGFPEVKLGIFPGFGGTVRSIRQVGVRTAMTMMLSGRSWRAKQTKKMGLAEMLTPQRHMLRAAKQMLQKEPLPKKRKSPSLLERLLSSQFARKFVANYLRKQTQKKVRKDHYPAPFELIALWEKHGGNLDLMLEHEAEAVAKLLVSDESQNLIRLFFLQNRLKALGKSSDVSLSHIHVIGAGAMGGDIAAWCALKGFVVTLQDQNIGAVSGAIKRAASLYHKKLRSPREQQAVMDRLMPDVAGDGIPYADLVIEAIVENLEIKQSLYKNIEPKMKKGAILASNTSGIPIDALASGLTNAKRFVGIHFFNPVAKMQLVEIISSQYTDESTLNAAYAFVTKITHLPLPVKSSPGFLVNRILMPYLMEAVLMVDEGISPLAIDKAALDFGMPMGPITLADHVGLDICLAVADDLSDTTGDSVPEFLKTWVESGRLGLKSGHGFYTYKQGKVQKDTEIVGKQPQKEIVDRLIMRISNEGVRCLREGIVEDGDLLDVGMVFGTGFAPFRGGVMKYIQSRGKEDMIETLERLEQQYGSRFKRDSQWKKLK